MKKCLGPRGQRSPKSLLHYPNPVCCCCCCDDNSDGRLTVDDDSYDGLMRVMLAGLCCARPFDGMRSSHALLEVVC